MIVVSKPLHDFPFLKYPGHIGATWQLLPRSCMWVIHHFGWFLQRGNSSCSINMPLVCLWPPIWSYVGNAVKNT